MSDSPAPLPFPSDLAQVIDLNLEACGVLARSGGFKATLAAINLATEALLLDLSRGGQEAPPATTDTTD